MIKSAFILLSIDFIIMLFFIIFRLNRLAHLLDVNNLHYWNLEWFYSFRRYHEFLFLRMNFLTIINHIFSSVRYTLDFIWYYHWISYWHYPNFYHFFMIIIFKWPYTYALTLWPISEIYYSRSLKNWFNFLTWNFNSEE